jgi:HlyD family secretion protein
MKPILINLNEMSDSREVYESKPNIFFIFFVYTILPLFAIAFVWMYFGHIDIVIKSEGMLRPNDQVATVMNTYSGPLEMINIKDGALVNEGDTLYVIEHQDLLAEMSYYEKQLADAEKIIVLLNKYKLSIEDGLNYFYQTGGEEEYYLKFQAYELNYEIIQNDYLYSEKERELNLIAVNEQLEILKTKLSNTEQLKEVIITNKNLFASSGESMEYYNLFLKYQSDYQSLVTQYDNIKIEIDINTIAEGLVDSHAYYQGVLSGLRQLESSIINEKSEFEETNSYSLQYEEYLNKMDSLITSYEQTKENYEINVELEGLAVTEWEVQQSKITMEEAQRDIDAYQLNYMANITTNITDVEKKLEEITLTKKNTISKDKLYEKNEADKIAALDNYRLKYIVDLDNTITTLQDNITGLETNKSSLELQGDKTLIYKEDDMEANLVKYRNNELQTTITAIDTYTNQKYDLQAQIDKINLHINEAIVKASKSGVINNNIELVEGDVLSSGTEVLTIIPEDNSEYKVSIYVSNKDIGQLKEGMKVKFNIYALPNSEYGYLGGMITNISKDIKVDQSSGSGYYLVEAKMDNKLLYDAQGREGILKAGMTCQAQMITESKRILTFVLEKIDLWIE